MSVSAFSDDDDPDVTGLTWLIGESRELCDWEEEEEEEEEEEGSPYAGIIAGITEDQSGWERWSLDRSRPGVVVITAPSGRRYACTPEGDPVDMPADLRPPRR